MLDNLKLLHAYIGGLIEQADAGALVVLEASRSTVAFGSTPAREAIAICVERKHTPSPGCDHDYRRIASGEYECRRPGCGAITDEPEGEQWR